MPAGNTRRLRMAGPQRLTLLEAESLLSFAIAGQPIVRGRGDADPDGLSGREYSAGVKAILKLEDAIIRASMPRARRAPRARERD